MLHNGKKLANKHFKCFLILFKNIFCQFQVMKADHTWRGMIIKDNEGDWGICVAAWRGMKKGKAGIPGDYSQTFLYV